MCRRCTQIKNSHNYKNNALRWWCCCLCCCCCYRCCCCCSRGCSGDVNSSPPWLFSGHFPRLDWRLWFIPLRLKSALKGAVAGTPSLLQQQQLQQQQMSLNAPSPACDSCGHGASPAPAQDDPLQLYPPFWRAFVNQLSSRQPAVLQLLGQQGVSRVASPS